MSYQEPRNSKKNLIRDATKDGLRISRHSYLCEFRDAVFAKISPTFTDIAACHLQLFSKKIFDERYRDGQSQKREPLAIDLPRVH